MENDFANRTMLGVSGSTRVDSANRKLIAAMSKIDARMTIDLYTGIGELPLFRSELDRSPWPDSVLRWRTLVQKSSGLVICTPAYLNNLPAALKNALEWLTTSGELAGKSVLPVTFTPHPPRGEKAMQSLIWSLKALQANIVVKLELYQNEIDFFEDGIKPGVLKDMIRDALELLYQ